MEFHSSIDRPVLHFMSQSQPVLGNSSLIISSMGRKRKFDLKWAGRPQPEIRAGISPLLVAGSCIYLILYSFFSSLRSEANIQMSEMIGLKKIHRDEEWEEA